MSTECYAMVRGRGLRVTALDHRGGITTPVRYATSKSVAAVRIDEGKTRNKRDLIRDSQDRPTLVLPSSEANPPAFKAAIEFLRADPALFGLIAGKPLVFNDDGDVVGFDAQTKLPVAAFALEVWTQLDAARCQGEQRWGYSLFPFIKGGYLTGFSFANGLTSFSLVNAQLRRGALWKGGPYEMGGDFEYLEPPVSTSDLWRTSLTTEPPPAEVAGVSTFWDSIDNGSAADPHPLRAGVLDGGDVLTSGPERIHGGQA